MNKISLSFLLALFPLAVFADSGALSFAPPASDYSVVFLGNIFGVVDGVLHGTGSQIMGTMFGVFNAAVLAVGGIIIMYTLIVSTMNTAQEGQMLGQKWSSLWIPIRSTVGLGLLIPKASGYCLMQIFVMWIVVQGVGAADKVWEAALSYLNRGGVIVQQSNPTNKLTNITGTSANGEVYNGAQAILAGQVCMIGLQQQLENQRKMYLDQKNKSSGSGSSGSGSSSGSGGSSGGGPCKDPDDTMKPFCDTAVPSFLNSVDIVGTQSDHKEQTTAFSVPMPNLTEDPYNKLNGICGTISWNPYDFSDSGSSDEQVGKISSITSSDIETAKMSRAIAVQQVYMDLQIVAQNMVSNDPQFDETPQTSTTSNYSDIAVSQFGVPTTQQGVICTNGSTKNCTVWGQATKSTSTLLNGTELSGAVSDYNGIMFPTLNLATISKDSGTANAARAFITQANSSGWIMAGSYFFYIVNLQSKNEPDSDLTDTNNGLNKSCIDTSKLTSPFAKAGTGSSKTSCGTGGQDYSVLATWLNNKQTLVDPIVTLIVGGKSGIPSVTKPDLNKSSSKRNVISSTASSTVYGYTNNATILQTPGQPGQTELQFANMIDISIDTSTLYLPDADFSCGKVEILFFSFCLGELIGDILYNDIIRVIYNFFLDLFGSFINEVIAAFLELPLQGMAYIFQNGLEILNQPDVNPIVALANMGTYYINFSGQMWMMLIELSIISSLLGPFGAFVFALIMLGMPLLLAWIGVMVMVGFTTAYYVPMLPYMIFTFGTIAWLISVIEAMVAAPIVALGVTHPEGHDAFGKGEHAIMILMNVFLRPALMIIGYISAIALSYVGVWILNAGFDTAIGFMQGSETFGTTPTEESGGFIDPGQIASDLEQVGENVLSDLMGGGVSKTVSTPSGDISGGYTSWAGIFAFFFSILVYTTMYLTLTQKAFTLIALLPDKVLRWIGGQPEGVGQEAAQWGEETKKEIGEGAKGSREGMGAMGKTMSGYYDKAQKKLQGSEGSSVQATGAE
jgi:defect-in-organelle-trafficking protein DotA